MTRRRLIVAAILLVASAAGAALWSVDRLSPEEQRLVGTWTERGNRSGLYLTLGPDRRCTFWDRDSPHPPLKVGRWWVREGSVIIDFEPPSLHRLLRPLHGLLGLPAATDRSDPIGCFDLDDTGRKDATFVRALPD